MNTIGRKSRRKAMTLLMVILMLTLCTLVACGPQAAESQSSASQSVSSGAAPSQKLSDQEIIDGVIDNFMLLAAVPRPSHHEEKIGAFLMSWAEEQGFSPVQDSVGNVMFDVPATEGMDSLPPTILQAHMDMVVVAEDDKQFDPLNDPITVIRDDDKGTLTADGTSLGGDGGAGLAIAMAVAGEKWRTGR